MKTPVKILLILLCAALVLAMPFTFSSPNMIYEVKMEMMNEEDEDEEIDFGRLLFSSACAEDAPEAEGETPDEDPGAVEEAVTSEGELSALPEWVLPFDFSAGQKPDKDKYTEDSYEDGTIRVKVETRAINDETTAYIASVQIADASQIRTGVSNPARLASTKNAKMSKMAEQYNAVIALNGDFFTNNATKTSYEYRMGQLIRKKPNRQKDILVIDSNGDFHLYLKSEGLLKTEGKKKGKEMLDAEEWEAQTGLKLVNAFTFGPALVKDGELLTIDKDYGYNPGGNEPRTAIGQTGPLSYVMVVIESRHRDGKGGMNHQQLAELMYGLGCVQAFNLDGGNTAEMVFGSQIYKGMPASVERSQSDIIYFATLQP